MRIDHGALTCLFRFRSPEGQVARRLERLQEYNFAIVHRSGNRHDSADALSRKSCQSDCTHCSRVEPKSKRSTEVNENCQPADLGQDQGEDLNGGKIMNWEDVSDRPNWEEVSTLNSYWAQWDSLRLENGTLKCIIENTNGTLCRTQLVIPR